MPSPNVALKCAHIKFEQFVLLGFKDDVPQFINTLFKFLTGADLRELLRPSATQNQFTKHLKNKMNKKKQRLLELRYDSLQLV